jgi:hypothetical protein
MSGFFAMTVLRLFAPDNPPARRMIHRGHPPAWPLRLPIYPSSNSAKM